MWGNFFPHTPWRYFSLRSISFLLSHPCASAAACNFERSEKTL